MRIPPYHKKPSWERFFAGMIFGAIVTWFFFLFTYGTFQQKQVTLIKEQREHISDLNDQIKIFQNDLYKLNEDNKRKLLIQSVEVNLINAEQYRIPQPDRLAIEEEIKDQISDVITKDIESVYQTKEILKRSIENKRFKGDGHDYQVKVEELIIYTRLSVQLRISFAK